MTETPKTLTVDVAKYEAYLADSELSDAEKQAFLKALWQIILAFVDLGVSVAPCEKHARNQTLEPDLMLYSPDDKDAQNSQTADE